MQTKAKLVKINSNHNNLRTNEVNGWFNQEPKIGESFMFMSNEVLTPGTSVRVITTTPLKDVLYENGKTTLLTQNSVYDLIPLTEG